MTEMTLQKSNKQLLANRLNALKSTGPKTFQNTRFNAIKHGVLSKDAIILTGEGQENVKEYNSLLRNLISELSPVGIFEFFLVEKIALDIWRLKRICRSEKGSLLRNFEKFYENTRYELDNEISIGILAGKKGVDPKYITEEVLNEKKECLQRIKDKAISKEELIRLFKIDIAKNSIDVYKQAQEKCEQTIDAIKFLQRMYDEDFDSRIEINRYLLSIPIDQDKIIRYEIAIERKIYRTLHELERLKMGRTGRLNSAVLDVNIES